VGENHTVFEDVYGGERKVTGHDPVKRNKKHVDSKEKAQRRGRKTETTTLGMGEDNVPFSKWADKNKSQKTPRHDFLQTLHTQSSLSLPGYLNTTTPPSTLKAVCVIV